MKKLNGTRLYKAFRRAVQQIQLAGQQGVFRRPGLLEIHGGIQECGLYPQLFEGGDLILHQRDQR